MKEKFHYNENYRVTPSAKRGSCSLTGLLLTRRFKICKHAIIHVLLNINFTATVVAF